MTSQEIAALPDPNPFFILPFVVLLLSIALLPVFLKHHWERHYAKISVGLGAITVGYYVFGIHSGTEMFQAALDYISFMVVTGSLFVITGNIHIHVKGGATPAINCIYLLFGALLGSVIGTAGASMVLIRPWIGMNKSRFAGFHLAFFIFLVSNLGGALTPVGPPLFMGYLKGVPFWWGLQRCWPAWCFTTICVLGIFYFIDRFHFLQVPESSDEVEAPREEWGIDGWRNVVFMAVVVSSVIFLPVVIRELVMTAATLASYFTTQRRVREANSFTFTPIKEVGWLFLGIFATMKPVLDYMVLHASGTGIHSDKQFFWMSGILSAVLDNAPTYLTFLAAAFGLEHLVLNNPENMRDFITHHDHYLVAISLGSTFFGAMTYLGNGPNLLVKAIAEQSKVKVPNFVAYAGKYSLPILLPVFALVAWLFF